MIEFKGEGWVCSDDKEWLEHAVSTTIFGSTSQDFENALRYNKLYKIPGNPLEVEIEVNIRRKEEK